MGSGPGAARVGRGQLEGLQQGLSGTYLGMEVELLKEGGMGAKFGSLEAAEPLVGNQSIYSHVFDFEQRFDERKAQGWVQENWVPMTAWAGSVYIILVFSGQAWMASRPAYQLRGPLTAWSAFLAIFSIFGFARVFPEFLHTLTTRGFYDSICNTSFVEANKVSSFWTWLFTLSKMPELGDTVFIVLRKQQLIFLHWYHHLTVLVYVFYCFSQFTSCARWFMTMNYFVHSLMYSYFALRAMRVRVPKVVAMIITSLQLVQMVVACAVSYNNLLYSALMYFSYFVLFARFFYKAYFCKSERRSLEKGATTGEAQLNGSPVSFGSVLQAGGKCSKDNNSPDKTSTEEESMEDPIVPTKENSEKVEEGKGVNLAEEKHPSALPDDDTDTVPTDEKPYPAEDEKEKDIITDSKEKLNSLQIVNGTEPAEDDKGIIGSAQISEEVTPSEEDKNRTSKQTEIFDRNSTVSNDSNTESKKDKWKGCNFDQDNKNQ